MFILISSQFKKKPFLVSFCDKWILAPLSFFTILMQFLGSDKIEEYVAIIETAKEEEAEKKRQKKASTATIQG